MKVCKKILLISVIAFILSIILGNIFNGIDFEIGRYISMGILYVSIASGVCSLIGYIITRKNENEKMPTWILVIMGIVIALVVANVASEVIRYKQNKNLDYYKEDVSKELPNSSKTLIDMAVECASDTINNRILNLSILGDNEKETIDEIRYLKNNNIDIILIKTKKNRDSMIYCYTNKKFTGSDSLADMSLTGKTSDEQNKIRNAKEIRDLWKNAMTLDTKKVLEKLK